MVTPPDLGACSYCGGVDADTWDVSEWRAQFARVLSMYEVASERESGRASSIAKRLIEDWELFSFDDEATAERLLTDVFGEEGHPFLEGGVQVRPAFDDEGGVADHATRWEQLAQDLREKNRHFPTVVPDELELSWLVSENIRRLQSGLELFRGRVVRQPIPPPASEMGSPPPHLVVGGRGNPLGIPHLYLANTIDTCVKESRASLHGFLSVATFRVVGELKCLNAVSPRPDNPFTLEDDKQMLKRMASFRLLRELGRELSMPVRPGANPIEYVPTQYLCEYVKHLNFDGVRYESALHPGGWNLVLFDESKVEIVKPVEVFEITEMKMAFEPAGSGPSQGHVATALAARSV